MKRNTQFVARMGILFAVAITLSYIESLMPTVVPIAPGIKLGLSNVVTMFCFQLMQVKAAFVLAVLKAGFAFLTRGATAGLLSLAGGLLSVTVLALVFQTSMSDGMRSVAGAVAHNLGQLCLECALMKSFVVLHFLPALLLGGILMGILNAVLVRRLQPVLNRVLFAQNSQKG